VTNFRPVGRRVPAFFSNLLPEGHLREYLASARTSIRAEFFLSPSSAPTFQARLSLRR